MNSAHMLNMTDDTGMLQHAIFSVPNASEGYTTDDNARALIVSILLDENAASVVRRNIAKSLASLSCISSGLPSTPIPGRFRNFLGYDRRWLEEVGSDDSHGRALWSLGNVLGHSRNAGLRGAAGRLFEAAVPAALPLPVRERGRSAFSACRLIWTGFPETGPSRAPAMRLRTGFWIFMNAATPSTWRWFEKSLSYSNARLPQALILAGWRSGNQRMIEAGMDSLKWLVAEQHRDDPEIFVPIGSNGFFIEGSEKARFDQQPVEACATISACLEVYRLTEESQWHEEAQRVFRLVSGQERPACADL